MIVSCNSASAQSLREVQRIWLPKKYPDKKVLGVIIPTVESALEDHPKRIGILGTQSTITSHTYIKEIKKRRKKTKVIQQAAPILVPLVESGEIPKGQDIIASYLTSLQRVNTLILGCTHYGILKSRIRRELPKSVRVISQNEIIPSKLSDYLKDHPEIERRLSKKRSSKFFATDLTPTMQKQASRWFGADVQLQLTEI